MLMPVSSACSWVSFQPWAVSWVGLGLLGSVPSTGPEVRRAGVTGIGSNGKIFLLWLLAWFLGCKFMHFVQMGGSSVLAGCRVRLPGVHIPTPKWAEAPTGTEKCTVSDRHSDLLQVSDLCPSFLAHEWK